ncbi:ImmA/IrrE family metallo-endopeptidase [Rhodanobacter glycinis]|uniref:DNA 3'-5' helicase n=1 Tax=Rhodanobacter glycinis TaxID=582702 RepID=A0A502BXA3_9GAMM|nr:UvrD-helicase domain-containing protein [Rhodanobacter glycinis]TPG04136.1 ImmA/IrrE family metallo-endopeptidase [Rhodanobacter glycinis]
MDGVEIGRQIAEALHLAAVAAGDDPWSPLALAVAQVKRNGLTADPSQAGAKGLNGGRACYIPIAALILYEDSGSQFDQAFRIAHELGHIHLGDSEEEDFTGPPFEIDPTRPAEAAPVGTERVIDYGRRQRREVQMDLFAREFLLPRSAARKLHLEQGMTASEIATRLGAPVGVVAQQLFDAILLPPIELPKQTTTAETPLNDLQAVAAKHEGSAFLLEAGPGTGKTKTLVGRIKHLLTKGVDPRRILVLTFSNKAAGEIADRIAAVDKAAAAAMWTGTFHAFGLDIIHRFYDDLELPPNVRMLDRTEAAELIENEFPRLGLVHYRDIYDPTQIISDMLAAISRAKDEVVFADQYEQLASRMQANATTDEERIAGDKASEVARVYHAYEAIKRGANAVDFGDLVSLPVRLLEGSAEITNTLRQAHQYILVDEYQDVNRSSVRLLKALSGEGENLWVVGDAKQSIYRFRGASSVNMERFETHDFPKGKRGPLKENYRSVPEITTAFSHFALDMKAGGPGSEVEPKRKATGMVPAMRRVDRKADQVVALAESILEMQSVGHALRDQAVLCTGNDKLSEFGQQLERMGIPVLFLGSLFERTEVKDLLAALTLLVDRRATGLLRTACMPSFAMCLEDVVAVMNYLRTADQTAGAWRALPDTVEGLSASGRAALARLNTALTDLEATCDPWEALAQFLLGPAQLAGQLVQSGTPGDRAKGIAVWQLLNFMRVQPKGQGLPIQRLMDRIRRLVRLADERDLRQLPAAARSIDAVRLMTIHGAKGLEFEIVHLPGMNKGTLPRTVKQNGCPPPENMIEGAQGPAGKHHEDETFKEHECLFYVGMSRARDRLFFYAVNFSESSGQRKPSPRQQSPFIDRLTGFITNEVITPKIAPPVVPEDIPLELIPEGAVVLEGYQVSGYERCERKYLYVHLLQVGGRARASAFLQMHDAVRLGFKSVVQGGNADTAFLAEQLKDSFAASGLDQHGYVQDYLTLAQGMLTSFLAGRDGRTPEQPVALNLSFGEDKILVTPDDVVLESDGRKTYRRVSTGKTRNTDESDLGVAALLLAARAIDPNAQVELVYLADDNRITVDRSATQLKNSGVKVADAISQVRAGSFTANPSSFSCPQCAAFFLCGPLPPGALRKAF